MHFASGHVPTKLLALFSVYSDRDNRSIACTIISAFTPMLSRWHPLSRRLTALPTTAPIDFP